MTISRLLKTGLDVAVVGGGHAGIEAAAAAYRCGKNVALFTHKKSSIGEMACQPGFGGIGKGHLLREVDAMDGVCPKVLDRSGIFYKMLNRSNGAAVWGPRAQIHRGLYKRFLNEYLTERYSDLPIIECSVKDFTVCDEFGRINKLVTDVGVFDTKSVVLCTGTFLNAETHYGAVTKSEGRRGEKPSIMMPLLQNLETGRSRTGTPPRVLARQIDYKHKQVFEHREDAYPEPFSYMNCEVERNAKPVVCYTTVGNGEKISEIVHRSKKFNAHIQPEKAKGPTYCPSIESKVINFGESGDYSLWLELEEHLDDNEDAEVYIQGCSSTMPEKDQDDMVKQIKGLENCEIVKYGYGVEYAFVNPQQLSLGLMVRDVPGLFLAGQINGTTGYEEAASQGLLAGANASLYSDEYGIRNQEFKIGRNRGYLGVMVSDLTQKGVDPAGAVYRMFTSRSEYRLTLRQDNADMRLTKYASVSCPGLISKERMEFHEEVVGRFSEGLNFLKTQYVCCHSAFQRNLLGDWGVKLPKKKRWPLLKVLEQYFKNLQTNSRNARRKNMDDSCTPSGNRIENEWFEYLDKNWHLICVHKPVDLPKVFSRRDAVGLRVRQKLMIHAVYEQVLKKQKEEIAQLKELEGVLIPASFNYEKLSIRNEELEILKERRPKTMSDMMALRDVNPGSVLMVMRAVEKLKNK